MIVKSLLLSKSGFRGLFLDERDRFPGPISPSDRPVFSRSIIGEIRSVSGVFPDTGKVVGTVVSSPRLGPQGGTVPTLLWRVWVSSIIMFSGSSFDPESRDGVCLLEGGGRHSSLWCTPHVGPDSRDGPSLLR